MRRAVLTMLLLAMLQAAAIGDVDYYNFEDDRIVPLGSRAVGTTSVALVGNDYVLKFVGEETITSSGDTAISTGGFCGSWRRAAGR